ncbi:receptor kinase-like protein Xa21 [Phragmites australis]|uniref:receptor kinase-like protein Xa21 n=1 Tax=Phragmites australis TaxID=29695 RepID=UPI002D77B9E6|nr:receptor kinase-like protein Xa21 [Phragmites australis]
MQGSIPSSFTSLRGITEMDLSQNNLSGEIPKFLETFSTLQLLNLSFNNLEGVVPTGGAFSNTGKVFVQGNKKLCTSHTMLELPLCMSTLSKRKKTSYSILIAVPLASVVVVLAACVAAILFKRRSHPKQHIDKSCKELKTFSYSDLAKATNDFSSANLVGAGRFGLVYKGTFEFEANPAAIKVFKLDQIGAPENFFAECEVLRNTRHRNLMRVISLCSSLDRMGNEFKALILEYMGNGSLASWLHSEVHKNKTTRPLNLGSRIMIATDIAAALDYLHNWCTPPLVHCDLKPSNVLLDDDMVAHVSDFGLAKFLYNQSSARLDSSTNRIGPRGSVGYIAPEYGMGCEISTAGDVYSYGVILLEMVTGKHPTDDIFKDGLNLHKLVESAFPQNIGEVLGNGLIQCYKVDEGNHDSHNVNQAMVGMQSCIKQMAKLGLRCSVDSPKDRPAIQDVYSEIIRIKETFSSLRG